MAETQKGPQALEAEAASPEARDVAVRQDLTTGMAKATAAVGGSASHEHLQQKANVLGLAGGIHNLTRLQERQGNPIPAEIGDSNTGTVKARTVDGNTSGQEQQHLQRHADILGLGLDKGDPNLARFKKLHGIPEVPGGAPATTPGPQVAGFPTAAVAAASTTMPTTAPAGFPLTTATPWTKETGMLFHVFNEATEKTSTPTYVNAKQYERIMHRRETRAILDAHYEKLARGKKRNKQYSHESRHLHSRKRPRNSKGKFLTKAELVDYYKEHPEQAPKPVAKQAKGETKQKPT